VPFEEQMLAFEPPKEGEVKVVIATNAAESSLTLPDVDHVICLGLCKQIVYNKASHRQMLVPTWISKASATQRAGRTGRVRKGNVYRLYSRDTFHKYMQQFDVGELVRTPLDSTILSLRDMLNEAVTPILLDCLEPPDISHIERSFQSLHASNFISDPHDEGKITSLGSLVVALGIDLTFGAFVGLGIQFGVAAEAIQLAAILSFPKTPWAMSSPLYHDTDTFNEIVSTTFVSRCKSDAGLFSEPMSMSNLLYDYSKSKDRSQFCWKHRVAASRMRHLSGTVDSLKRRVAGCLNVHVDVLEVEQPPRTMPHAKINILRILQVWLFYDTMIMQNPYSTIDTSGTISVELEGPPITRDHLEQILDPKRHPFRITNRGNLVQRGHFDPAKDKDCFFHSFETRFTSYMLEKKISLAFYYVGQDVKILMPTDVWKRAESANLRENIIGILSPNIKEVYYLQNNGSGNQRGVKGRDCGAWQPSSKESVCVDDGLLPMTCVSVFASQLSRHEAKEFEQLLDLEMVSNDDCIKSIISCRFSIIKKKHRFVMTMAGECNEVTNTDLRDLFAASDVTSSITQSTMQQCVNFPVVSDVCGNGLSNACPMLVDAPEGARLMSVLASERRRDNFIRFSDGYEENNDEEMTLDVNLPKSFSISNRRWKRKGGGGMVFVPENCVPSAVIPTNNDLELFCCCANTLDLRGGAIKVDGITMLPPGRLFVGLALLCFGVNPRSSIPIDLQDDMQDSSGEEKKEAAEFSILPPILPSSSSATTFENAVQDALGWIHEKDKMPFEQQEHTRVAEALNFHTECMDLGEALKCQPDKIKSLCAIFDEVDGHAMYCWDGHDISLNEATSSTRPKSNNITNNRHTKNSTERSSESASIKMKARGIKEHPRPSQLTTSKSKNISRKHATKKNPTVALLAPSNEDGGTTKNPSQCEEVNIPPLWMCPTCEEMFVEKKHCAQHIERCSFGLVKQTRPKMVDVPKK